MQPTAGDRWQHMNLQREAASSVHGVVGRVLGQDVGENSIQTPRSVLAGRQQNMGATNVVTSEDDEARRSQRIQYNAVPTNSAVFGSCDVETRKLESNPAVHHNITEFLLLPKAARNAMSAFKVLIHESADASRNIGSAPALPNQTDDTQPCAKQTNSTLEPSNGVIEKEAKKMWRLGFRTRDRRIFSEPVRHKNESPTKPAPGSPAKNDMMLPDIIDIGSS